MSSMAPGIGDASGSVLDGVNPTWHLSSRLEDSTDFFFFFFGHATQHAGF